MKKVLLTLIFAALVSTSGNAMDQFSQYANKAKSAMGSAKMPSMPSMNSFKGMMGGKSRAKASTPHQNNAGSSSMMGSAMESAKRGMGSFSNYAKGGMSSLSQNAQGLMNKARGQK
ncbi:MAG: hypothetical protein ACK4V2_03505 [Pseudomonadota bacterium]|jgi:hypothetical protein|nr:hypothetical protein [Alphaproteobacteria bacterium]